MKLYVILALLLLPIIIFADAISFTLENSQITPGGVYGYLEFDVVAVSDVTHYMRGVQVYLDYPIAAFGPLIDQNMTLEVTTPNLPTSYYITVNDNTPSRVSLAANLVGFIPFTLSTTPVALFHAKIIIADPTAPLTVAFEPNLMTGNQFYTDGMTNTQYNIMTTGDPIDETLPVELSSFTANLTNHNFVSLNWVTQSETGVVGFSIYRSQEDNLETAELISPMIQATNTSQMQSYIYVDEEVFEDGTYYYWLENADLDGSRDYHGPTTIQYTNTSNNGTPALIPQNGINNVYPNPFNPTTCIVYGLKDTAPVDITIYNSRGQKIRSLLSQTIDAGTHRLIWNGTDDQGSNCTSGVYIVRMTTPQRTSSQKVILLK